MNMTGYKKRRNPLGVMTLITAALFLCAVMFYFITGEGDFSLTGVLDSIFAGGEKREIENNSNTLVNIYALNDSYDFDVDFEAEEVVFDYFRLYYGALGELRQNELAQLYTYTSSSRVFDEFVHSHLTELRRNSNALLTFPACDVELTYEKASSADGLLEITVNTNFSAAFDGLNGTVSVIHNQRHFFKLKKNKGKWLIDAHEDLSSVGQYFNGIFNLFVEKDGYKRSDITLTYMPRYLEKTEKYLYTGLYDMFNESETEVKTAEPVFDEPYDRAAAVAYAMEWNVRGRIIRNLTEYTSYENNSANFTSQCVRAGGVPMDALGSVQWKWYTNKLDESERSGTERTGYSRSWIKGDSFYTYAQENTGFGMVAASAPVSEAEKGDVVQLLKPDLYGGEVVYQCLVTGVSRNELIVTGNSDDIINTPLSVLGYDTVRLIKIYGYNTSNMNNS